MNTQIVMPLILVALVGGYNLWAIRKRYRAMANLGPAYRRFFERTGYRYSDVPDRSIEAQVRTAEAALRDFRSGRYDMDLVRDFHGVTVHHVYYVGPAPGSAAPAITCTWSVAHEPGVAVVEWQAAARSLEGGLGSAVAGMFNGAVRRGWNRRFPTRVDSGDAELDAKLVFYGRDAEVVRRVLAAPGLRQALVACTEVDLIVDSNEARFNDPTQKNLRAAMGGMVGAMAIGHDIGRMFDLGIPVHERIAELLALAARASRLGEPT